MARVNLVLSNVNEHPSHDGKNLVDENAGALLKEDSPRQKERLSLVVLICDRLNFGWQRVITGGLKGCKRGGKRRFKLSQLRIEVANRFSSLRMEALKPH
jgi:hypothetical protein